LISQRLMNLSSQLNQSTGPRILHANHHMKTPVTSTAVKVYLPDPHDQALTIPYVDMLELHRAETLYNDLHAHAERLAEALENITDDKASLPGKHRWEAYDKARQALTLYRAENPKV